MKINLKPYNFKLIYPKLTSLLYKQDTNMKKTELAPPSNTTSFEMSKVT